jgi:hypothetical protein
MVLVRSYYSCIRNNCMAFEEEIISNFEFYMEVKYDIIRND